MHIVQKHGIAIVCLPSVRLSDHLSVMLMYREHIGWTSSKLITPIISLGLRSSEPQHRQSSNNNNNNNNGTCIALFTKCQAVLTKTSEGMLYEIVQF